MLSPAAQATFDELASAAADSQLSLPRLLHARSASDEGAELEASGSGGMQLQRISRDALAHLMNLRGLSTVPHDPLLIDVRRCGLAICASCHCLYGPTVSSPAVPSEAYDVRARVHTPVCCCAGQYHPHSVPQSCSGSRALGTAAKFQGTCRYDERALYGCIPDSVHVPLADLLFALPAGGDAFEALTRLRKPERDRMLIMHSRECARAELAALLALENGAAHPTVPPPCAAVGRLEPL